MRRDLLVLMGFLRAGKMYPAAVPIHGAPTERSLKDYGDKVGIDEKTAIETALTDLKGVIDSEDSEAIKEKTNALAEASMKLGEAMYKASQAEAEAKAAEAGKPAEDDVVDADFEEVKDDDKKSA